MLTYAVVGTNDVERAKAFYDALLETIGMKTLFEHPSGGRVYVGPKGQMFGVLAPYDGAPATAGNGSMFGFSLDRREEVDAFHAKAMELGATDEGAPGLRGTEKIGAYFAYFRDADGNKLCAFKFG